MRTGTWAQRFLASTRGKVVALLRRRSRTVNELADELDLTDNAVRAHLATLERDGLVRQSGTRRGKRKPHQTYALTPEAERIFPKAYEPVLDTLLGALEERLSRGEVEEVLRETGQRLAAPHVAALAGRDREARIRRALELLGEMGGAAEMERPDGAIVLQGTSCPLAGVIEGHPAACKLAESMLAELIGAPVREECDKSRSPSCRFVVLQREEQG